MVVCVTVFSPVSSRAAAASQEGLTTTCSRTTRVQREGVAVGLPGCVENFKRGTVRVDNFSILQGGKSILGPDRERVNGAFAVEHWLGCGGHEFSDRDVAKPVHHGRDSTEVVRVPVRHNDLLQACGATLLESRRQIAEVLRFSLACVDQDAVVSTMRSVSHQVDVQLGIRQRLTLQGGTTRTADAPCQ